MHPWSAEVKRCPYAHYDAWRSEAPVVWNPELAAWLVLGYDEARSVLDNDRAFSSANSIFSPQARDVDAFPSMINADGGRRARLRAYADKILAPRTIERDWRPAIERTANDLMESIGEDPFDLVADLASPLPARVLATMLGVGPQRHEWFQRCAQSIARGTGVPMHEDSEAATGYFGALTEVQACVAKLVDARALAPRDGLLTRLIEAEVAGERMTVAEQHAFIVLLLIAGVETTASLISGALRTLAEDGALLERVRDDRTLVWNLIEESLRVDAPLQGLYRRTTRDVELAGAQIKAGDALCVLFAAANRDPAYVEHPERFRLDAARGDHLAFGSGVHACPGAEIARTQAEIVINAVLDRFETLEPVIRHPSGIEWSTAPFFRSMASYPVRWTPRFSARRTVAASSYGHA